MVFCSDGQESVEPLLESGCILPKQVMQENPHRIHAQAFGPAEFLVDLLWIERFRLPHFELVRGARRKVVATDQPRLVGEPVVGLGFGPTRLCMRGCGERQENDER